MAFLPDKPFFCYNQFMGAFWMAMLIGTLGNEFALPLAIFFVYLHHHYEQIDVGNSFAFCELAKHFLGGDETMNPVDYLIVTGLQFGGALVGGILFCLLSGEDSTPVAALDNDGRLVFFYLFATLVQATCFYLLGRQDKSFQGSFKVVAVYYLSWSLAQKAFSGAVGGVTIDVGRWIGSKIVQGKDWGTADFKFWTILVGGFAGMALAPIMHMIEGPLREKQDGTNTATAEPAAEPAAVKSSL